ncbi:MAG: hypothetical protein L0154_03385 [Chloroflexi bacterium]|nr:hypothetical protein [Chloroflexota bacterium]
MDRQHEVCINCLRADSVEQHLCAECNSLKPRLHDLTRQILQPEFELLNLYKTSDTHPWSFHYAGPEGWTDHQSYVCVATTLARDCQLRDKMSGIGLHYIAPMGFADAYIFDLNDCIMFVKWVQAEGFSLVAPATHGYGETVG